MQNYRLHRSCRTAKMSYLCSMENIAVHIEKLLTRHECVIVPGLGGFLSYRESAVIRGLQMQPPRRSIRFNALLSYQDGLLAEAVMQSENVGYKAALAIIEREVLAIRGSLGENRAVQFGRIGRFSSDGDNAILFTSDDCSFLPENLGSHPVYLKKLSPLARPEDAHRNIVIQLPAHGGRAWRYAAAIVFIFMLSLLAPTRVDKGTLRAFMPCGIPEETRTGIRPAQKTEATRMETAVPDAPATETVETAAVARSVTAKIAPAATSAPQRPASADRYHLIVASLPSRPLAEKYIGEQTSFPQETLRIIECDGKYRIAAASFSTRRDALRHLDSIRGTHSAWILCH
ncbi:MAG: hypothetical protein IAC51_02500 [bacterium]|uniref:SPOR domain-containing protein n=1 Tax=Candidatus Aphodosoma intestinipullorum TaxID=2840674 RepID=A0A940IE83_9BACT|nr:hypothetical protein [Candidatus Aphodosoma intestinipullorum]